MAGNRLKMLGWGLALLVAVSPACADVVTGRVVGVSDGDTITVLDGDLRQHKIRIAGIGAPEKGQAFGQRSKDHLSKLVFGKVVDVQWSKHDRYRRIVGKVMVAEPSCRKTVCPKSLDAGLGQITVGLAWWYRQYASEQTAEDASRYRLAENEARARRVGLWSDAVSIPPWAWRKERRGD